MPFDSPFDNKWSNSPFGGGSWLGGYDFEGNEAVFVDDFAQQRYFNDGVKSFAALNTFTRASDGTYEDSLGVIQTAATNEARFPYRSGTAEGGLIEPAATNLRTRSEDFTHGDWTYDGASSSGNTIAGPDGLVTADTITENTANSLHRFIDYAGADNTRHTISRWVKADGRTKFTMFAFDSDADTNYASASFDIDAITSAAEPSGGNGVTHFTDIIEYANGWFRLIFSFTANTSGAGGIINMQLRLRNSSGVQTYIGDGVSGIHIAAAQLEIGDYATSYIKTEASSASRASDAMLTTSGGLPYANWDATKVSGKIVIAPLADGVLNYVSLNDGTANEVISVGQDVSNNVILTVTDGGVDQCVIDSGVNAVIGTELTIAYRAGANDFAISVDGNAEVTDVAGTMPTVTQQDIGEHCTFKSHVAYAALITDLATLSSPGATSFVPTDIATLVGWYEADTVTLVGLKVSQWDDLSGLNNHMTQATDMERPLIIDVGGLDYLDFQTTANKFLDTPALTGQHTVFMLIEQSVQSNLIIFGDGASASVTMPLGLSGSTSTDVYRLAGTPTAYLGTSTNAVADRGDAFTLLDGGPKVVGFENYTATSITRLGKTPSSYYAPNIRAMLIYSGTLTTDERADVVSYLDSLS